MIDALSNALISMMSAESVGKSECLIVPASKLIVNVLKVLLKAGYIGNFEYIDDGRQRKIRVQLMGRINKIGVIKPKLSVRIREYEDVEKRFLPSHNMGMLVVSTSKGVMSHTEAKQQNLGGIILAYVY